MQVVTVKQCYEAGKKAYDDGVDFFDCPDHYTTLQQEIWEDGWKLQELIGDTNDTTERP